MTRTARVGVVADTHVGEFLEELPRSLAPALAGCDLILHAGDLSGAGVIEALEPVAPVVAVRGDHDLAEAPALPRNAIVAIAGVRIGLTHGERSFLVDASVVAAGALAGRDIGFRAGLARHLVRRFGPLEMIVHGHWHEPVLTRVGDTLVFSPGAVCPWGSLQGGRPPRPGLEGVADRLVRRFRRGLGEHAMRPRIGIIEIGPHGIDARSVPIGLE